MDKKLIKNISVFFVLLTLVIMLVSKNLFSSIKISLIYGLFFYIPSLILINKVKDFNTLEKFTISNLIGLSYGSIYFVLDVLFKVSLSTTTFITITIIFYVLALYVNKKTRIEKNDESPSNI